MAQYTKPSVRMADPMDYVFPPPRAAASAMRTFRDIAKDPSPFDFGITYVDDRYNPLLAGELASFIARPGNGKTFTMIHLAKRWSQAVAEPTGKQVILYATWETLVEEFIGVFTSGDSGQSLEQIGRGRADLSRIQKSLLSVLGNNVFVFGRSKDTSEKGLHPPSLMALHDALSALEDDGIVVRALLIDYLQRIPGAGNKADDDRSSRVSENLEVIKDLALRHKCATVVAVQARRDVDEYGGIKMPSMADAQWSSVVEQTSDKVFGLSLPGKYLKPGSQVIVNGFRYTISERTLAMQMLKQRFGGADANDFWLIDFDAARAEMGPHRCDGEAIMAEDGEDVF